jgi:hypothetical protein
MLQDKNMMLEEGKIFGFKLFTGDEIFAKIVSVDRTDLILQSPKTLMQGEAGIQLGHWPLFSAGEADLPISRSSIVTYFLLPKELQADYERSISKIVLVTKPGIIT